MVFRCRPGDTVSITRPEETGNPFEYQNTLFHQITGSQEDVFVPVNYSVVKNENREIIYKLEITSGDKVLLEYTEQENRHMIVIRRKEDRMIHAVVYFSDAEAVPSERYSFIRKSGR